MEGALDASLLGCRRGGVIRAVALPTRSAARMTAIRRGESVVYSALAWITVALSLASAAVGWRDYRETRRRSALLPILAAVLAACVAVLALR